MPRQIFEQCPNLNVFVFLYVPACISGHSLPQDGMWFDKLVGPRFCWQGLYFCVCLFCVNLVLAFAFAFGPNIFLVVYVFSCSKVCHLCLFVLSFCATILLLTCIISVVQRHSFQFLKCHSTIQGGTVVCLFGWLYVNIEDALNIRQIHNI